MKDRKEHEAKRGVKTGKATLSGLSREKPTADELADYPRLLALETERGAILMASALVEEALAVCIQSRMADVGPAKAAAWFEDAGAPFGSFSVKIALGRAMGIYGENHESMLDAVRQIRNAFAHSSRPISFAHPVVAAACKKMNIAGDQHKERTDHGIYLAASLYLAKQLIENGYRHGNAVMTVDLS